MQWLCTYRLPSSPVGAVLHIEVALGDIHLLVGLFDHRIDIRHAGAVRNAVTDGEAAALCPFPLCRIPVQFLRTPLRLFLCIVGDERKLTASQSVK